MLLTTRRGQVEMTFHWIYVLLAGVVILLFFVGIVVKQKAASEQSLGTELSSILESIFTSASVSEATKIALQTPGFAGETLFFTCHDDEGNQFTEYGLLGKGTPRIDLATPLFSPAQIKGTEIYLWSLPYTLPYKIVDFLFITSPSVKYVLLGQDQFMERFVKEAKSATDTLFSLAYEHLSSLEAVTPGALSYRIVDVSGEIVEGKELPLPLQKTNDADVTAVVFNQAGKDVAVFYHKKGTTWVKEGASPLLFMHDSFTARLAAVFSGSKQMFDCSMKKAWLRGLYVAEVYLGKAGEILTAPQSTQGDCPVLLNGFAVTLNKHKALLQSCLALYPETCVDAVASAQEIRQVNEQLRSDICISLY